MPWHLLLQSMKKNVAPANQHPLRNNELEGEAHRWIGGGLYLCLIFLDCLSSSWSVLKHIWPKPSIFNNCENPPWALQCSFRLSNEERQSKTQFQGQRLAINSHLSAARTTSARASKCQLVLWIQPLMHDRKACFYCFCDNARIQTNWSRDDTQWLRLTHAFQREERTKSLILYHIFIGQYGQDCLQRGEILMVAGCIFLYPFKQHISSVLFQYKFVRFSFVGKKSFVRSCKGLSQRVMRDHFHTKLVRNRHFHHGPWRRIETVRLLRIDTWLSPRTADFASRLKPSITSHFPILSR